MRAAGDRCFRRVSAGGVGEGGAGGVGLWIDDSHAV